MVGHAIAGVRDKAYSDALGVERGGHLREGSILDRQEHGHSWRMPLATEGDTVRRPAGSMRATDGPPPAYAADLRYPERTQLNDDDESSAGAPFNDVVDDEKEAEGDGMAEVTQRDMDNAAYTLLHMDG